MIQSLYVLWMVRVDFLHLLGVWCCNTGHGGCTLEPSPWRAFFKYDYLSAILECCCLFEIFTVFDDIDMGNFTRQSKSMPDVGYKQPPAHDFTWVSHTHPRTRVEGQRKWLSLVTGQWCHSSMSLGYFRTSVETSAPELRSSSIPRIYYRTVGEKDTYRISKLGPSL